MSLQSFNHDWSIRAPLRAILSLYVRRTGPRVSSSPPTADSLHHHSRRMGGRDLHEAHRVATPLELLFDLTFVIAFGLAASQLAHALAEGHFGVGLLGFGFGSFAICWAWINFS